MITWGAGGWLGSYSLMISTGAAAGVGAVVGEGAGVALEKLGRTIGVPSGSVASTTIGASPLPMLNTRFTACLCFFFLGLGSSGSSGSGSSGSSFGSGLGSGAFLGSSTGYV